MMLQRATTSAFWDFFRVPFQQAEAESREYARTARGFDWKTALILVTTAVTLTIQEYAFGRAGVDWIPAALDMLGATAQAAALDTLLDDAQNLRLAERVYWAVGTLITYILIPGLVVKVLFRERLRDFGLNVRGIHRSAWAYLVMLGVMVPVLLWISTTERFLNYYPFYRLRSGEPLWPRFCIWEAFYVLQFFALEFFFRGFLVLGLRRRFGFYAIFAMMVPYCMIHFGKPMPETFAAIIAGIVLGFMSLKTRSIWFGAAIHVAVALGMDFLSLWRNGLLG
jgi:membrane protease YdiL (CAAX protease family)